MRRDDDYNEARRYYAYEYEHDDGDYEYEDGHSDDDDDARKARLHALTTSCVSSGLTSTPHTSHVTRHTKVQ